jgi:glutamate racemase
LEKHAIGVFDSGYGGLTVLKEIIKYLPEYDVIYAGDNARSPYGTRSFETVYRYTLEAVKWLFSQGCHLIVIACNTASAKALRSIQQRDLPLIGPEKRVLGVIRPVTEMVGSFSNSRHIGIFATPGTVRSKTYVLEINKFFPDLQITQEACPIWVPLIENNEINNDGASYFIKKHIDILFEKDPQIDTVILGCTHYPIIIEQIRKFIPSGVKLVNQGTIVAESLVGYLNRHPEIDRKLTRFASRTFFTSDNAEEFDRLSMLFFGEEIRSTQINFDRIG